MDSRITYQPKTAPRAHQAEALRRLDNMIVFALLMDMGTGKSKVILDKFGALELTGQAHDLGIIAPAGSITNWYEDKSDLQLSQLKTHLSEDLYKRLAWAVWTSKQTRKQQERLEWLLTVTNRPRALFVNIEALSRKIKVNQAYQYCAKFLDTNRKSILAVDESTGIRNTSLRTEAVQQLGRFADIRYILTGLITPKNPLDLYRQFEFLDPRILGYSNFATFRARYAIVERICMLPQEQIRNTFLACVGIKRGQCLLSDGLLRNKYAKVYPRQDPSRMPRSELVEGLLIAADGMKRADLVEAILAMGGYIQNVPQIKGYQNIEELQQKIAPWSYRVTKDQALDLPPKIYQIREVALTTEQKKAYGELLEFATTALAGEETDTGHVTASSAITQIVKLHQLVCGYGVDEHGGINPVRFNRIDALIELLDECEGKVIIWAEYLYSIYQIVEALEKEYGKESVATFSGANKATRGQDERRFLSDPLCRFMVASYAGSLGNTWINANTIVYFANTYDLEKRMQSEDRSHRDGLRHSVTYVDLMAMGTVDEKIVKALRNKINMATAITGEGWKQWLI
jgi:SNF2 family DNA or RNA helicase